MRCISPVMMVFDVPSLMSPKLVRLLTWPKMPYRTVASHVAVARQGSIGQRDLAFVHGCIGVTLAVARESNSTSGAAGCKDGDGGDMTAVAPAVVRPTAGHAVRKKGRMLVNLSPTET